VEAGIVVGIYDILAEDRIAAAGGSGGNFDLGPPIGTITFFRDFIPHANRPYEITYSARVFHFDPTPPGTHGDASGEFHIAITPFPEQASATLMALALLVTLAIAADDIRPSQPIRLTLDPADGTVDRALRTRAKLLAHPPRRASYRGSDPARGALAAA